MGISPTHDANEVIICSLFVKGPRKKASQTPLLVGRGYPQDMMVFCLHLIVCNIFENPSCLVSTWFHGRNPFLFFPTPWGIFGVEVAICGRSGLHLQGPKRLPRGSGPTWDPNRTFSRLKSPTKIPGGPRHQL